MSRIDLESGLLLAPALRFFHDTFESGLRVLFFTPLKLYARLRLMAKLIEPERLSIGSMCTDAHSMELVARPVYVKVAGCACEPSVSPSPMDVFDFLVCRFSFVSRVLSFGALPQDSGAGSHLFETCLIREPPHDSVLA